MKTKIAKKMFNIEENFKTNLSDLTFDKQAFNKKKHDVAEKLNISIEELENLVDDINDNDGIFLCNVLEFHDENILFQFLSKEYYKMFYKEKINACFVNDLYREAYNSFCINSKEDEFSKNLYNFKSLFHLDFLPENLSENKHASLNYLHSITNSNNNALYALMMDALIINNGFSIGDYYFFKEEQNFFENKHFKKQINSDISKICYYPNGKLPVNKNETILINKLIFTKDNFKQLIKRKDI